MKTFVTVARTANVTRAAEKLNTTPPSVSNHIRMLEEEFGVVLFTRNPKGMFITSQGEKLLKQAQDILDSAAMLVTLAKTVNQNITGPIRLGINADPAFLKIPDIIDRVFKDYPGIQLEIVTSCTSEILDGIQSGKMTCGYAFGPVKDNGITSLFLRNVDLVIGIPVDEYEARQAAPLRDIAAMPWIVPEKNCPFFRQVQSFLDQQGIALSQKVFANDDITKIALVKKGAAVCVLEQNEAAPFIESGIIVPWQGPETFANTLSFVSPSHLGEDILIKTIVAIVTEVWQITPG